MSVISARRANPRLVRLSAVIAGILVAGGCALNPGDDSPDEQVAGDSPNFQEWKPTTKVMRPSLPDTEKLQIREQHLASYALSILPEGVLVPDIALVRWIDPDRYAEEMVACLNDEGFLVEKGEHGGFTYQAPNDDPSASDSYRIAMYVCEAKYTWEAHNLLPPGRDSFAVEYEYWTEFYLPCLAHYGITVQTPAPSKEVFITQRMAGDPEQMWMPPLGDDWAYEDDSPLINPSVRPAGKMERAELDALCPQTPSFADLYG